MCGIFGGISPTGLDTELIRKLGKLSARRGKDSSGFIQFIDNSYQVFRSDMQINKTLRGELSGNPLFFAGHSRLITNGFLDNQPVEYDGIYVIHNGIVLNTEFLWGKIGKQPRLEVDSEILPALASFVLESGGALTEVADLISDFVEGVVSCILIFPRLGKLLLISNNGSLYFGKLNEDYLFASEEHHLRETYCTDILQVKSREFFDIPTGIVQSDINTRLQRVNLVPVLFDTNDESQMLNYEDFPLKRCSKCILPETMPFIKFNDAGICNYCENYKPRNSPKPVEELYAILEKYKKVSGPDCLIPFSGGRDSSYGLHLAVKHFGMKPIAYTYDWGMVTDLGRRNISRMCGDLRVENIIVAADISWKRNNIRRNLQAWLKSPDLGMLSLLTSGDKHFFRHIEKVKIETGIDLNLWSVNPLEVTHFKSGFLGIQPDFESSRVYKTGLGPQLEYQNLRFRKMLKSPGYFNLSLIDTLSGEYFRSRKKSADYFHLFDYWRWDEQEIDNTLDSYGWERAADTSSTWRIGDGTAAFYNYVYHRVAGFSEHDTFRSNQIREGQVDREKALRLAKEENLPRYQNLKWYLDTLGLDFKQVIETINRIPRISQGLKNSHSEKK
jgi:glucosamine--fructose-6-phosphate aminotransferase (isomerizing)